MPANTNTDLRNGVNGDVGCKYPCDCATTAPIELEGTQTIDGFSAVENKIVLVKNQTNKTENGPYVVSTGSWERGVWFNSSLNATAGSLITVAYGSTNAKTIWETVCADANIDFGTSEIDFELKVKGSNTGDKSVSLTGEATGSSTESSPGILTISTTLTNSAVITKVLTGISTTASAALLTTSDTILSGFSMVNRIYTNFIAALSNGFAIFAGASGTVKTYTLPNADATLLYNTGPLGTPASGVGSNLTGIPEGGLTLTDVTTNNVSTERHGFIPKLSNVSTQFFNGSGNYSVPSIPSGSSIQTINTQTGAVDTTTVQMPYDDTIPQNTEGKEFMSLAITPTSATNKIRVQVVFNFANSSGASAICLGLFQDSTANALAAVANEDSAAGIPSQMVLDYTMTAGTTSATTFKVRAGPSGAQTLTFNGSAGARKFGGVMCSSITITEIKV